jgi:hypothetical protein
MDNVKKTHNGINMPSSQTFRTYQNIVDLNFFLFLDYKYFNDV